MKKLRDWVIETNCHHVAIEDTDIYLKQVYAMLESWFKDDINILMINAWHMKNVQERKTDMRNAQ